MDECLSSGQPRRSKQASRPAGRPGRQAASRCCGMVRQQAGWPCELVRQVAAELGLRQGGPAAVYGQVSPGKVNLVI